MKKILIVDDEQEIINILTEMLRSEFHIVSSLSGKDALSKAVRELPDLVLLDINMSDMDGFEVCKRIREQPATRPIPVIMLTTATGLDDRVKGLDLGADDYISKPFQARELVARIHARLRRVDIEKKSDETIVQGNLKMNPKSFQVWVNEKEVHLTKIEFELLRYFLDHPNEVIDRQKLLGDLWPDSVVTNRTVDTHMANLRKKISGFNNNLNTIYGAGYILKPE